MVNGKISPLYSLTGETGSKTRNEISDPSKTWRRKKGCQGSVPLVWFEEVLTGIQGLVQKGDDAIKEYVDEWVVLLEQAKKADYVERESFGADESKTAYLFVPSQPRFDRINFRENNLGEVLVGKTFLVFCLKLARSMFFQVLFRICYILGAVLGFLSFIPRFRHFWCMSLLSLPALLFQIPFQNVLLMKRALGSFDTLFILFNLAGLVSCFCALFSDDFRAVSAMLVFAVSYSTVPFIDTLHPKLRQRNSQFGYSVAILTSAYLLLGLLLNLFEVTDRRVGSQKYYISAISLANTFVLNVALLEAKVVFLAFTCNPHRLHSFQSTFYPYRVPLIMLDQTPKQLLAFSSKIFEADLGIKPAVVYCCLQRVQELNKGRNLQVSLFVKLLMHRLPICQESLKIDTTTRRLAVKGKEKKMRRTIQRVAHCLAKDSSNMSQDSGNSNKTSQRNVTSRVYFFYADQTMFRVDYKADCLGDRVFGKQIMAQLVKFGRRKYVAIPIAVCFLLTGICSVLAFIPRLRFLSWTAFGVLPPLVFIVPFMSISLLRKLLHSFYVWFLLLNVITGLGCIMLLSKGDMHVVLVTSLWSILYLLQPFFDCLAPKFRNRTVAFSLGTTLLGMSWILTGIFFDLFQLPRTNLEVFGFQLSLKERALAAFANIFVYHFKYAIALCKSFRTGRLGLVNLLVPNASLSFANYVQGESVLVE